MTATPDTTKLCHECSRIFSDGSVETFGRKILGLPSHVTQLSLVRNVVLSITYRLASGNSFRAEHDLDLQIGAKNGCFECPGRRFSRTAQHIRLVDTVVHAQLLDYNQHWNDCQLQLAFPLPESESAIEVQAWAISDNDGRHVHHKSRQTLQKAIDYGCALCTFVDADCDLRQNEEVTSFFLEPVVSLSTRQDEDVDTRDIYKLVIGGLKKASCMAIRSDPTPHAEVQLLAEAARTTTSTGSIPAMQLAKTWLEQCLFEHAKCPKPTIRTWRPTRLLEVAGSTVRLVSSSQHSGDLSYATLSHCWGKPPLLLLTSQTMFRFRSGIAVGEFDLTFRDAFGIIESIGVRYIWIDCYCIIQGTDESSATDWAQESTKMDLVYSNAVINIGATNAANSQAGCFKAYSDRWHFQRIVRWRPRLSKDTSAYEIQAWGDKLGAHRYRFKMNPLFRRGW